MTNNPQKVIVENKSSGGYLFLAFVVLLVLKLSGTVSWSWWIITLPLWIGPAILVSVILFVLVIAMLCMLLARLFDSKTANDLYVKIEKKLRK